ncbi:MAG: hypothetical protein HS132_18870 [Planctomycetia bacterium]|nr:hypothetical protein [Planctomycetia bacterium]
MFNRYTYLLAYLCIPMLFLFGCSTSFNKKVNKKPDIRLLEKRIDDLSGKISLIIYDTNVLHNEMDEINTANKTIQEKIEGLEVTVSVLNEQVSSLHTPARVRILPNRRRKKRILNNRYLFQIVAKPPLNRNPMFKKQKIPKLRCRLLP